MYKIYINDTPLILIRQPDDGLPTATEGELVARYPGKSKFLLHYVNMLENTRRWDRICMYSPNLEDMWSDFQKYFAVEELIGVAILDGSARTLFKKNDHGYQLPGGPAQPAVDPATRALQIAGAKTGLKGLSLAQSLAQTFHTAREGKQRILKKTHWFRIQTPELFEEGPPPGFQWVEISVAQGNPGFIPAHISTLFEADGLFD